MVSPEGIGGVRPESVGNDLSAREAFENRTGVYAKARFGRVITAMVTPFHPTKLLRPGRPALNTEATQRLAVNLQEHGSEGLVVAGTTGQASALKFHEQIEVIKAVRDAVDIPVIAGTGSNDTEEAVELTRRVTELGIADAVLLVSPYYVRPSQDGIIDYYEQTLSATDLPALLYDIPIRTGREVDLSTIDYLAGKFDNFAGVKDAAGNPGKNEELIALGQADVGNFEVYSGDDSRNLAYYRAGAVGAISVASHWAGLEMAAMFDAVDARDYERAEAINRILEPSYDFEGGDDTPNPIPTKEMMNALGLNVGRGRSPMVLRNEEGYIALNRRAHEVYVDLQNNMRALQTAPLRLL